MSLPESGLFMAVALVPIIFLLGTVLKLGWSVSKAAPYGLLLALIIALGLFKSSPMALCMEAGKGVWNAATILLVIWPAVFSYELTCESDAFSAIRQGIQSLTQHKLLQILIFGWVFPSFLQGITGFGVAVAVGAPLLRSIGVSPFYSIIIVLLCHSWGATYGTLALAWDALVQQAGLTGGQLTRAAILAALMIWLFNVVGVLYSCWIYGKAKALREIWPAVLILSLIMGGGQLILAPVNSTICFFIPAAIALGAVFFISRMPRYHRVWALKDSKIMETHEEVSQETTSMSFHQAFLPYYLLTAFTIVCLLIPPINRMLSMWKLGFAFPETVTGYGYVTEAEAFFSPLKPLTYAGTFLVLSSMISIVYYQKKKFLKAGSIQRVWMRTVKKCIPSTIAITSLIVMAKFMGSSGQIYVLSKGVIRLLGRYYVILAPIFGMIGAFITSSNMSSNILLGNFQVTAAEFIHVEPAITCALQTTGGVLGDSFAPGSIIMGVSTTGYQGKDGDIIKVILPMALILGILFGLFAFLFLT